MPQGRLDLFEVHVVEQAYGPVPFFYDHIEVRGPRVDAAALREFCNREPFFRRILRTPQEPDPVKAIVHQQADVPGTRTSVRLDLVLQRPALCRVAQHREEIVCVHWGSAWLKGGPKSVCASLSATTSSPRCRAASHRR